MLDVQWTSYDPLERGTFTEDPLGFFAHAMRLAELWLPGITTRTRRARYYTMVCAGLHLIESEFSSQIKAAENHDAERVKLFLRWERLWAIWNYASSTEASIRNTREDLDRTGFIGRRKIRERFKDDELQVRHADFHFIERQSDLGALGSYRSSLESLGFVSKESLTLLASGERLAELFWYHDKSSQRWNKTREILESGRLRFGTSRGMIGRTGRLFGLDAYLSGEMEQEGARAERELLRSRLFPENGIRTDVLRYLAKHDLKAGGEIDALSFAAKRGVLRSKGVLALERSAAAIIALERYRACLMAVLELFRRHLIKEATPCSIDSISKDAEIKRLCAAAQRAQRDIVRWERGGEFLDAFKDFALGESLRFREPGELLQGLMDVHLVVMRSRNSLPWFHSAGGNKWDLDLSVAFADSEDEMQTYNYRTRNIIGLATELRSRI